MDFQYVTLKQPEVDIRLISILPGALPAPLKLLIWHTPLVTPLCAALPAQAQDLTQVQRSLPSGWIVAGTPEGNLLYEHEPTCQTSWTHSNPEWNNQHLYEPRTLPPADFEPRFEALSYLWGSQADRQAVQIAYTGDCELTEAVCPGTSAIGVAYSSVITCEKP
jgi:hypothetical protein